MRRAWCLILAVTYFASCSEGREPPRDDPACEGETCEPCEPETDVQLCAAQGAFCGSIEVVDSCGEMRVAHCGACQEGFVCEKHRCEKDPEAPQEPGERSFWGCRLVPPEGQCRDLFTLERCVQEGEEERYVVQRCKAGMICTQTAEGASCESLSGACAPYMSFCTSDGHLRFCHDGQFVDISCEYGCTTGWAEARCRTAFGGTVLHRGQVHYEHRVFKKADDGKWTWVEKRPAAGLYVLSLQGADVFLDQAVVGEDGTFEVLVPKEPTADHRLIFMAVGSVLGGPTVGVVDPDLPPGTYPLLQTGDEPRYWSWEKSSHGDEPIVITERQGSVAVQIFQGLRQHVWLAALHRGLDIPDLHAWFGMGVTWDCGACFYPASWQSAGAAGIAFLSSGEIEAASNDFVIFHESGHYIYDTLGPFYSEGGIHCVGVPTYPGQALNEGLATWNASILLKDPVNVRSSFGTYFYVDLERMAPREYFAPPDPRESPYQKVNETWVSATAWKMAKAVRSAHPIYAALYRPEMRPPFRSGYTARQWWSVDEYCLPQDVMTTDVPTATLVEMLDALVCSGFPAEHVRELVSQHFPYDPDEAVCK